MNTKFSVIIPVVGQPEALDESLASILRDAPTQSEIVLVHDGTFEDQYDIGDELTIVDAQSKRLSAQIARAMEHCCGEIVAIVRPGVELPQDWDSLIARAFDNPKIASVTPVMVSRSRPDQIVSAGVRTNYHFRRMLLGTGKKVAQRVFKGFAPLGPTSWVGFYRRATLTMIGDLDQKCANVYFDLDLALTLKQMGYQSAFVPKCVCQVDRPATVVRESQEPHGASAQRSIARHSGSESGFARGLTSFACELVSAILAPGAFQQAVGRLGGRSFKAIDRAFAERMEEVVRRKDTLEKTGLRVFEDELSSDVEDALKQRGAQRRAA